MRKYLSWPDLIWASLDPSSIFFVTAKSRPKTAPGLSGPGCFSLDHKNSWNEEFSKRTLTAVIFDQMAPAKICLLDLISLKFPIFWHFSKDCENWWPKVMTLSKYWIGGLVRINVNNPLPFRSQVFKIARRARRRDRWNRSSPLTLVPCPFRPIAEQLGPWENFYDTDGSAFHQRFIIMIRVPSKVVNQVLS